jgi:hypothetical protein
MLTIGRALSEHLKQNNAMPKLFQVFPSEGKRLNTEQYVAHNFLGYSFLNSVYTVLYKDSTIFKVFVIETAAPEKANAMLAEYFNAVPKETVSKLDPDKYKIRDPHSGEIVMQMFNRYVCGIINCPDGRIRDRYLQEVASNLLK